jgi:PE-PPE domain-containing protein
MSGRKLRWLGFGLLATAGASLMGLTSVMHAAFAYGDDTALVMGGSGIPIPPQTYLDAANDLYLHVPDGSVQPLTTPEGAYPVTGVNSLQLDTSVAQGVTTLNNAIMQQIAGGNHVDVFGYSQSTIISSMEMAQLQAAGVPSSDVNFTLVGDLMNPNGGIDERFVGLSFPSFGQTFSGATPSDLYPTDIYTIEYDGFADFPRYPIDLPSDLNADLGIFYEHFAYLNVTPEQMSGTVDLGTFGDTTYNMIPAESLPLLDPLRLIPVIGQPLYNLLEPDTAILVNLGYGSITQGWDTQNPPDVPTPFGLFPTDINPADLVTALLQGAQQGITDAIAQLGDPANYQLIPLLDNPSLQQFLAALHTIGLTPTDHPTLLQFLDAFSTLGNGGSPISPPANLIDAFTASASADLGVLKPLVDNVLALGITLPQYDATLFVDGLQSGNLVDAIGNPIAADIGLVPHDILFNGLLPIVEAAATTVSEFASLIP